MLLQQLRAMDGQCTQRGQLWTVRLQKRESPVFSKRSSHHAMVAWSSSFSVIRGCMMIIRRRGKLGKPMRLISADIMTAVRITTLWWWWSFRLLELYPGSLNFWHGHPCRRGRRVRARRRVILWPSWMRVGCKASNPNLFVY